VILNSSSSSAGLAPLAEVGGLAFLEVDASLFLFLSCFSAAALAKELGFDSSLASSLIGGFPFLSSFFAAV